MRSIISQNGPTSLCQPTKSNTLLCLSTTLLWDLDSSGISFCSPTKNGKIACDLHHASIDDNLPFEALSYCWGKSEILHDISLKGKRFSVTENLYLALYQLRLSYEVRNLWIDALCIDQKHDNEKTHQVELMSSIFQHASQVLVWLGPTADNSNIAIDFISSNKERKSPHCRLEMNDEESAALLKLASRPW